MAEKQPAKTEPTAPLAAAPLAAAAALPARRQAFAKEFALESFRFNTWSAELDETQTLADALDPRFWAHQAAKIMGQDKSNPRGRGDLIIVRKADTSLYAKLLVVEVGAGFIKVELVEKAEPAVVELADKSPLATRWNAGKKSHDVIRASDKAVMAGGFQTKASAAKWIEDHIAAMAA